MVDPSEHRTGYHEPVTHHPLAGACGERTHPVLRGDAAPEATQCAKPVLRRSAQLLDKSVEEVRQVLGSTNTSHR
ncbi:MAG: hypothetical protein M5R42_01370 [Rhodocyclaceae bacterium]|nr:hypothetical protein [Rhodocyclaceae bacterium]